MSSETAAAAAVRLERDGPIATLTLDRPDALNAIDEDVLGAMPDALAQVRDDESCRALVVRGAGERAFSVGLDLDLLGKAFAAPDYFADVVHRFKRVLLDLERLPVLVVAAVDGLARAGGFELLLACDVVIVTDDARIGDTHVAFGLPPGGGASQRLPRRVGHQRAADLLLTGRWLRGPECVDAGLALRSVPAGDLDTALQSLLDPIRSVSRAAVAATKRCMLDGAAMPIEQAVEVELDHFVRFLHDEPTADEGYRAYVEGRSPDWERPR